MSYTFNLKKSLDAYNDLFSNYSDYAESTRYAEISRTMPYEFVSGLNICRILESFNNDEISSKMAFTSAQDATAIYNRIMNFNNKYKDLLESADFVIETKTRADAVNALVSESLYLPTTMKIKADGFLESIARECLEKIPKYPDYLTKKFRNRFTESCIESLPNEELDKLIMNKLIKSSNLDMISPIGSKEYEAHLAHVCNVLQHNEIAVASYKQSIKGTTFDNEDGTNRQSILKEIEELVSQGKTVFLTAEQFSYKPEIGNEEPAIKVLWNGKIIGYIAKDVVFDVLNRFENPKFKIELKEITGGEKVKYGCNVDLKVYSMAPMKELVSSQQEIEK